MKNLVIIPARSGSKRIKNKNTKLFNGNPIIKYSINNAIKSKLFDKIHVSTNSKSIANLVEELGLKVDFLRPKFLADDKTGTFEVIKFVAKKYTLLGKRFDNIWLLSACSPLINHSNLIQAYKLYKSKKNKKALLAVNEYTAPIEWAHNVKNGILTPNNRKLTFIRSQDLTPKYHDSGSFTIFPSSLVYKAKKNYFYGNFIPYQLKKFQAVDIDDHEDWKLAELIHKSMK